MNDARRSGQTGSYTTIAGSGPPAQRSLAREAQPPALASPPQASGTLQELEPSDSEDLMNPAMRDIWYNVILPLRAAGYQINQISRLLHIHNEVLLEPEESVAEEVIPMCGESNAMQCNGQDQTTASQRSMPPGKVLSGRTPPSKTLDINTAYDIAANWRSAHAYPLHAIYMTLRNRARRVCPGALIAKRLKRMPSIADKLKRLASMQLSQMQDLGGCRAVVDSIAQVDALVQLYDKQQSTTAIFCKKDDYIANPKPDGYRGVHFVYQYSTKGAVKSIYQGLRIEVQIRSAYQHAWATAVEIIDAFTGQSIKSGGGILDWKRFFVLISSFIAEIESRPLCPMTEVSGDWVEELKALINTLDAIDTMHRLSDSMDIISKAPPSEAYILVLNSIDKRTEILGFTPSDEAARQYADIERAFIDKPHVQAVMVSVDSIDALRQAYPNYYVDTARFVGIMQGIIGQSPWWSDALGSSQED